jgi:hypothetical protein
MRAHPRLAHSAALLQGKTSVMLPLRCPWLEITHTQTHTHTYVYLAAHLQGSLDGASHALELLCIETQAFCSSTQGGVQVIEAGHPARIRTGWILIQI